MNPYEAESVEVLMPVPLRWAPQVAELLRQLCTGTYGTAPSDGVSQESVIVDEDNGTWTRAMAEQLATAMPYAGVRALIDACAASPGQWIPKSGVEEAAAVTPIQLRNELVALSKLTSRLFGRGTWPMASKKELGSYYYRLHPHLAEWWREARSNDAVGGGQS